VPGNDYFLRGPGRFHIAGSIDRSRFYKVDTWLELVERNLEWLVIAIECPILGCSILPGTPVNTVLHLRDGLPFQMIRHAIYHYWSRGGSGFGTLKPGVQFLTVGIEHRNPLTRVRDVAGRINSIISSL